MPVHPCTTLFDGFSAFDIAGARVRFSGVTGGSGPAVLLLHGYPETHAAWHTVAPALAVAHTVVIPDLPGYGNSRVLDDDVMRSKREVAAELVGLMHSLGHECFAVVGHDRGARVGYRLALDHPTIVTAYAALAAVPSLDVWPAVDRDFARANFHWFLFLQPRELAAAMLAADPDLFLDTTLTHMAGSLDALHPAALNEYRVSFRRPSVRAAMLEDYRAAYGLDTEHDAADRAAGRQIACPVLSIWGDERLVAASGPEETLTAAQVWRRWAQDVTEVVVPTGHLIPEQAGPDVASVVAALVRRALRSTLE